MYRSLALSSLVAVACATSAAADPPQLKGSYGFTGTAGCLIPSSGFNGRLQALGTSFSRSFSVEGIRTFNGDGTGTVMGTTVSIVPPPTMGFLPSASSADFQFSFNYTVSGDGSWTSTMVPGSYIENITAGPRAGQTATVDAIPPIVGMISKNGMTLTGAHLVPTVETVTFSNGDVEQQICHRSRIFISLRADNDE
jgi:hypothetical protein